MKTKTNTSVRPVTAPDLHKRLQAAKAEGASEEVLDALLALCYENECQKCSEIICPQGDAFHFHHDGCPGCAEAENPSL